MTGGAVDPRDAKVRDAYRAAAELLGERARDETRAAIVAAAARAVQAHPEAARSGAAFPRGRSGGAGFGSQRTWAIAASVLVGSVALVLAMNTQREQQASEQAQRVESPLPAVSDSKVEAQKVESTGPSAATPPEPSPPAASPLEDADRPATQAATRGRSRHEPASGGAADGVAARESRAAGRSARRPEREAKAVAPAQRRGRADDGSAVEDPTGQAGAVPPAPAAEMPAKALGEGPAAFPRTPQASASAAAAVNGEPGRAQATGLADRGASARRDRTDAAEPVPGEAAARSSESTGNGQSANPAPAATAPPAAAPSGANESGAPAAPRDDVRRPAPPVRAPRLEEAPPRAALERSLTARPGAPANAPVEAKPGTDKAYESDPKRWLERIVQLRRDGRDAEADLELKRLRERYPDAVVPGAALRRTGTR